MKEGKYVEAERLFKRALAIRLAKLGEDHPDVAATLANLALVTGLQGNYFEGVALYNRALAIQEEKLGKDHPDVVTTLTMLATFDKAAGRIAPALAYSRQASTAVISYFQNEVGDGSQAAQSDRLIKSSNGYFHLHLDALALADRQGLETNQSLGSEGFEIAQWALQSAAAAALQQMSARFASERGALAVLVREQQDLAAAWREREDALTAALANPGALKSQALVGNIRQQLADLKAKLMANAAQLKKEFPDYAELALPSPLKLGEAQQLLAPEEALIFLALVAVFVDIG